jgi:hypothetical protein
MSAISPEPECRDSSGAMVLAFVDVGADVPVTSAPRGSAPSEPSERQDLTVVVDHDSRRLVSVRPGG